MYQLSNSVWIWWLSLHLCFKYSLMTLRLFLTVVTCSVKFWCVVIPQVPCHVASAEASLPFYRTSTREFFTTLAHGNRFVGILHPKKLPTYGALAPAVARALAGSRAFLLWRWSGSARHFHNIIVIIYVTHNYLNQHKLLWNTLNSILELNYVNCICTKHKH